MKTKKVKKKGSLDQEVLALKNQLARALADYQNLSKRIEKRQSEVYDGAVARIVDKLLDVYDDFRRAQESIKDKGLSMAVNQFWAVLQSEGIEEIETNKVDFDPELMDCVQVVDGLKNKTVETVANGYLLQGKVIRPAKVKVGRGKK